MLKMLEAIMRELQRPRNFIKYGRGIYIYVFCRMYVLWEVYLFVAHMRCISAAHAGGAQPPKLLVSNRSHTVLVLISLFRNYIYLNIYSIHSMDCIF
jgi:hypothetical protein